MFKKTSHETIKGLVDRMNGLIIGASPRYQAEFNTASTAIWEDLGQFLCAETISIAAKFPRTRRMEDHTKLPREQSSTTIFVDHHDTDKRIEVKAGELLGLAASPVILDDTFVFSLNVPVESQIAVVRWSLMHPRPTIIDIAHQPAIQ